MEHKTYTKINTLYKRYTEGPLKGCIEIGNYSTSEIAYLKDLKWDCFEKIDGTNISIYWDGVNYEYHGKTENADIPKGLISVLDQLINPTNLKDIFNSDKYTEVRIYGEGFGGNIQGNIGKYYGDFNFIVFDISINNIYLDYSSVLSICKDLNLKTVPFIGSFTLKEAEDYVRKGFKSQVSEDPNLKAEGLVCRPTYRLFDNKGDRIITKIKTCDYQKLEAKQ